LIIEQTRLFAKQKKKLHKNQIQYLDSAVKKIANNPGIGDQKKGDLSSVSVYKFKILAQEYLLAYQADDSIVVLLSLGSHENFYRDLKRKL